MVVNYCLQWICSTLEISGVQTHGDCSDLRRQMSLGLDVKPIFVALITCSWSSLLQVFVRMIFRAAAVRKGPWATTNWKECRVWSLVFLFQSIGLGKLVGWNPAEKYYVVNQPTIPNTRKTKTMCKTINRQMCGPPKPVKSNESHKASRPEDRHSNNRANTVSKAFLFLLVVGLNP